MKQSGFYLNIYMEDIKRGDLRPGKDMFVPFKENKRLAQLGFKKCRSALAGGKYDLVIMDEINVAVRMKLVKASEVIRALRERKEHVSAVLTGRHATKNIMREADSITEMKMVKHYFTQKVEGRIGIEY